VTGSNKNNAC